MEASLKQMKFIWAAMLGAAVIYVVLPQIIQLKERILDPFVFFAIGIVSVGDLVLLVVLRKMLVQKAEDVLRLTPNDPAAMQRWRTGQVVTFAAAESIVLLGLVMRFLGATTSQAAPWYVTGIIVFLIFRPKDVR